MQARAGPGAAAASGQSVWGSADHHQQQHYVLDQQQRQQQQQYAGVQGSPDAAVAGQYGWPQHQQEQPGLEGVRTVPTEVRAPLGVGLVLC